MKTPVILIIFNRPDVTEKSFAAIRQAQPAQLLVIADGPRPRRPDDAEKCAAARAIIDRVDWDCQVLKNFADTNMGCGIRVSSGLTWAFDLVEEAIVLEDDCLPHPTFFQFCEEMLERYRDDRRIMHISGNNFWSGKYPQRESYLFSKNTLSWGWATWRRAWQHYDFKLTKWWEMTPEQQADLLADQLGSQRAASIWQRIFGQLRDGSLDTWDYQWTLTCWLQSGLCVQPHVNLVSNVGFGADATHTFSADNDSADCPQLSVPSAAMNFPLIHPPLVIRDLRVERFIQENLHDYAPKFAKRVKSKLRKIFKR